MNDEEMFCHYKIHQLIPLNDSVCAMLNDGDGYYYDALSHRWLIYIAVSSPEEEFDEDGYSMNDVTYFGFPPDGCEYCFFNGNDVKIIPNYHCPECTNRMIPDWTSEQYIYRCPMCGKVRRFSNIDPYTKE